MLTHLSAERRENGQRSHCRRLQPETAISSTRRGAPPPAATGNDAHKNGHKNGRNYVAFSTRKTTAVSQYPALNLLRISRIAKWLEGAKSAYSVFNYATHESVTVRVTVLPKNGCFQVHLREIHRKAFLT